jgi:hypothetical protein
MKIIENYKKPTPPKWRKAGDFALIALPVLEAQLNTMPDINEWYKWTLMTTIILFKLWTNTQVENNENNESK